MTSIRGTVPVAAAAETMISEESSPMQRRRRRRRSLKRKRKILMRTMDATTTAVIMVAYTSISCLTFDPAIVHSFVTMPIISSTTSGTKSIPSRINVNNNIKKRAIMQPTVVPVPVPSSSEPPTLSPTSAVFFTVDEYHAINGHAAADTFLHNPLLLQRQQLQQLQQQKGHEFFGNTTVNRSESESDVDNDYDYDYDFNRNYNEYDYHRAEEEYVKDNTENNESNSPRHQQDQQQQRREREEEAENELPIWLRRDKSHLVEENMEKLRSAMVLSSSSFFSESEGTQLIDAIQRAAYDDDHKMAGAAEFCLYMVEVMEMGLNALIAAAFHYCECIDARERSIARRRQEKQRRRQQQHRNAYMDVNNFEGKNINNDVDEFTLSHWEFRLPPQGIEKYDEHAARIERDAARLKRLEVLASMVIHRSSNNSNKFNNIEIDGDGDNNFNGSSSSSSTTTNTETNNSSDATEKAADILRDLYTTEAKDWRALAIRGAACLYRLRGILQQQEEIDNTEDNNTTDSSSSPLAKSSNRVCREAFHIYAPLASRMGMHRLKNELEHAAFKILYRRQHRAYESLLRQKRSEQSVRSAARRRKKYDKTASVSSSVLAMETIVESSSETNNEPNIGQSMQDILHYVKNSLIEFLNDDAVFMASVTNFEVTARVKESYSTWRKMIRNGFDHILQVPDAMALRIVLDAKKEHPDESDDVTRARERALCYYVQQLCQTAWVPHHEDSRFRDYIANPKENGYQSLHYTARMKWKNEEWKMEFQIRTSEMHKVAEFGVASHWKYKYQNEKFGKVSPNSNNQSSDAYLRSLQDWHWQRHGGSRQPLVLWDDEAESRKRAERIRSRTQRLKPYLDALADEQNDLQRKNVFIFLALQHSSSLRSDNLQKDSNINQESLLLTEGTVVALPAGSSILDVILKCKLPVPANNYFGVSGGVGCYDDVVTQNGIPASLSSRLQNGDVLSIPSFTACCTTPATATAS